MNLLEIWTVDIKQALHTCEDPQFYVGVSEVSCVLCAMLTTHDRVEQFCHGMSAMFLEMGCVVSTVVFVRFFSFL